MPSNWTLTWSGYSPYEVLFDHGDGTGVYWPSTTLTSSNQSYTFYPCVGTTFRQYLNIWDAHGNPGGDDSHATEGGGSPC